MKIDHNVGKWQFLDLESRRISWLEGILTTLQSKPYNLQVEKKKNLQYLFKMYCF